MKRLGLALTAAFLLVAAVGTFLALRPSDQAAPGVEGEGVAEEQGRASEAPAVLAAGRRAAAADAPRLAHAIQGNVVDVAGAPVAGVRVTATRTGVAYDVDDPTSWTQLSPTETTRRRLQGIDVPVAGEPRADAEGASDAGGRFTISVREPGAYVVRAIPAAPSVGETGSVHVLAHKPPPPLRLRVRPGVVLAGRVVDAADRPVAGAVVTGMWRVAGSFVPMSVFGVATGPDGAFVWEAVPEGTCSASVTVAGRGTYAGFESPAPRGDPWVIRLPAAGAIHGRVLDAAGAGIADVDLVVNVRSAPKAPVVGTAELRGRSGPDGGYRIEGVPPGPVAGVSLLPSGTFLPEQQTPPRAPWSGAEVKAGEDLALDLVLSRGGALEVTVVGEDGAPLEGAEVSPLSARAPGGDARSGGGAVTDGGGRVRIDGLALGRYVLYVRHPTHYLAELEKAPRGYVMSPDGMPVGPAVPSTLVAVLLQEGDVVRKTVRLLRGLAVTGRVTGPDGAAVEGARVSRAGGGGVQVIWQWGVAWNGTPAAGATTDGDGRFRLDALPPTEDLVLAAKKPPLVGTPSEAVRLTVGAPTPDVALVMAVGASVSGTVRDAEGKAPQGLSIDWWGGDGVTWSNGNATCDEAGAFRCEGLSAGSLTLNVRTAAGVSRQVQVTPPIQAGERREGLLVTLARTARVAGTTVDADGAPVGGVPLNAHVPTDGSSVGYVVSQADGSFVFPSLPEGAVSIQVLDEGEDGMQWAMGPTRGEPIRAPAEGVKVIVTRRTKTRVVARILGPDGVPVPLCTVRLASGAPMDGRMLVPFGGGGGEEVVGGILRREFGRARPFDLSVSGARDADGAPMNLRPKTFPVTTDAELEVRLDAGREITGRATGADGRGVMGVQVTGGGASEETDADGRFRLRGLAVDEEVTLAVSVPAGWIRPAPRRLGRAEASVTIELEKGVAISGRVLDPDGEPCKQFMVQVQNGSANAQPLPGGRFRIDGLAPGAVVDLLAMSWSPSGGTQRSTLVKAVRAGTEDLVIRFEIGVVVEGIVVDAKGQPVPQGWVMAQPLSAEGGGAGGSSAAIGPDGRFRFEGLKAGPHQLQAQAGDGTGIGQKVEAPARDVRIVLPARSKLTGRVLGTGDRAGFRVTAYAPAPGGPEASRPFQRMGGARTDADGSFTMDVTGEGPFELLALKPDDDRWASLKDVRVGGPSPSLTLEAGLAIEGTVEAPGGGAPPEGTWVLAQGTDGRVGQRAAVAADGSFRVRGLPPGTYRLLCGRAQAGSSSAVEAPAGSSGHRLRLPER